MKPASEVLEAAKFLEERRFLTARMLAFFRSNEEEVQSLLSKIETIKMDMAERVNNVGEALGFIEEGQERKVRSIYSTPAYQLYDICEHEIQIDRGFYLVINTIITPQGWRFRVFARKLWNRPSEINNQRAISWYEAQPGPRTFPYYAEPSEVADQLRRLIDSAQTDPFPLPE